MDKIQMKNPFTNAKKWNSFDCILCSGLKYKVPCRFHKNELRKRKLFGFVFCPGFCPKFQESIGWS